MQHNVLTKGMKHGHEEGQNHGKSHNPTILQNAISPKQCYGSDFGRGTNDPDNVRRQKQDYFDNWK